MSNLQTGLFAGPVGSDAGQHRFTSGLRVREAQQEQRLYTPLYGIVEARVAAIADPNCMVALWMIGFEDQPDRSAEICVFEIFGRDVAAEITVVGMGLHPFGEKRIADDFRRISITMDALRFHIYSVEWLPGEVRFFVDDELVTSIEQSPDYPMQLMLNIYEFEATAAETYPKVFEAEWVRGWRPRIEQSS